MIAFANPTNNLKFFVISDKQTTEKFCCVALEDGCVSLMGKVGVSPSPSVYDSQ